MEEDGVKVASTSRSTAAAPVASEEIGGRDVNIKALQTGSHEYYKRVKLLGEGSQGKAYLVQGRSDGCMWVIKQVDLNSLCPEEKDDVKKEARILAHLSHPNITNFKEIYYTVNGKLCLVMEYADGGDLQKVITSANGKFFKEEQILDWFTQICLGLKHVHDRKIIHRDLKGANVMMTQSGICKLGDFGVSRVLNRTLDKARTMVGTPYYLSPEIINHQPYSFKSDIWSLGVLLYELCALKQPFNGESLNSLALAIVRGEYPQIPKMYSNDLKKLVASLLQVKQESRPTIKKILMLPYIKNRIRNFLSETIRIDEFSHTILHNQVVKINSTKVNLTEDPKNGKQQMIAVQIPASSVKNAGQAASKNPSNVIGQRPTTPTSVLPKEPQTPVISNQQQVSASKLPSRVAGTREGNFKRPETASTKRKSSTSVGRIKVGLKQQQNSSQKNLQNVPSKQNLQKDQPAAIVQRPTTAKASAVKPQVIGSGGGGGGGKSVSVKSPSIAVVNRPLSGHRDPVKKPSTLPVEKLQTPSQRQSQQKPNKQISEQTERVSNFYNDEGAAAAAAKASESSQTKPILEQKQVPPVGEYFSEQPISKYEKGDSAFLSVFEKQLLIENQRAQQEQMYEQKQREREKKQREMFLRMQIEDEEKASNQQALFVEEVVPEELMSPSRQVDVLNKDFDKMASELLSILEEDQVGEEEWGDEVVHAIEIGEMVEQQGDNECDREDDYFD